MILVFVLFASAAQAEDRDAGLATSFETESLGDGLYAFRIGMRRSIFLVGDEGVIATDPLNVEAASIYRAEIARITDQPVTYVAYTSSFFDRIAGGRALRDSGTRFIAHENCVANLRATPHPDIVQPDASYADTLEIPAGNVSLTLYYFGQSYGTCLSVMIARPANIMLVMNLVNPPAARLPEDPTLGNYYLHNIVPFFESVEQLAAENQVELVVGSAAIEHDGLMSPALGPATLITEQRLLWETLLGVVKKEFDKGTPAMIIPRRADLTPLAGYAGYDEQSVRIMMRRIYSLYRIGR